MQVDSSVKPSQEHPKADTVSTEDKKDKHMDDIESGKNGAVGKDAATLATRSSQADASSGHSDSKINNIGGGGASQESGRSMGKTALAELAQKDCQLPKLSRSNHTASTPIERVESDLEIQNREVSAHRSPGTKPEVMNSAQNCLLVKRYQIPQRRPLFTSPRRKLLILDVNGLLADIVNPPPLDRMSNTNISGRAIFKRPFYYDFLNFCFERFDVGIWSSRSKWIIDRVVDYLLGNLKHKLKFCWNMFHCTQTSFRTLENRDKPLVLKELRKLWEKHDPNLPWEKGDYDESNTLLVDDSPYKALLNPMHTGVFPYSYKYTNASDNSLGPGGDLRVYLEGLATAENVQNYVAQYPFGQGDIIQTHLQWSFYSQVLQGFGLQSDKEQTH